VVRGRPNPLQAAGLGAGRKLMEIKRLRERGHRITLLSEAQFWRLVQLQRTQNTQKTQRRQRTQRTTRRT